jgi:aldose 1-epimerase
MPYLANDLADRYECHSSPDQENAPSFQVLGAFPLKIKMMNPHTFQTLTTTTGLSMTVSAFGARITQLLIPDRHGELGNVVLGLPNAENYLQRANLYLGCTVGPVAGRITGSRFVSTDLSFDVQPNEGENHLHGGSQRSWDRIWWDMESEEHDEFVRVTFRYTSPDGEEGYPGNVKATSEYTLSNEGVLTSRLLATTDAETPLNLTTHNYWNLSGVPGTPIGSHQLSVATELEILTNHASIPTGELSQYNVFINSFAEPRVLQEACDAGGIDATFVLQNDTPLEEPVARVVDPESGRRLTLFTTEPAMQVYTGAYLPSEHLSDDCVLVPYGGVCLEPQRIIDNPLLPQFPSIVLKPGHTYKQVTVHVFDVVD